MNPVMKMEEREKISMDFLISGSLKRVKFRLIIQNNMGFIPQPDVLKVEICRFYVREHF